MMRRSPAAAALAALAALVGDYLPSQEKRSPKLRPRRHGRRERLIRRRGKRRSTRPGTKKFRCAETPLHFLERVGKSKRAAWLLDNSPRRKAARGEAMP